MTERLLPPAARPCASCPYRADAPSGVWAREEYEKLPAYDADTPFQPDAVFLCHQRDGRICAGWAGCHDMEENLAVRFAAANGRLTPDDVHALWDYTTDVLLWPTGAAAAAHGIRDVDHPGPDAERAVRKLIAARDRRDPWPASNPTTNHLR